MLLAFLQADLAGEAFFLASSFPPRVAHGQLARIGLLLALGSDHRLAHTHLTDEEFHATQFDGLARLETVALSLSILVFLLTHNQVGLFLSQRDAVGLLRVGAFRTNLAKSVISVVHKI